MTERQVGRRLAIKFTARGRVTLRVTMLGPTRIGIEVEETGAGISAEELPRVFETFEQTQSGRASGQGTGLGLAICRELVRVMGGEITAKSELGKGSIFSFEVPVVPLAVAMQSAEKSAEKSAGRLHLSADDSIRVLIADDVEDNRTLLRQMLLPSGFRVREAKDGAEAVQLFEEWHPQIVLTDVRMPVLDGLEATRRIRAAAGGADVRIIVVTASAFETDADIAKKAGADAFLRKPVRERELLEQIGALMTLEYREDSMESVREAYVPTREALAALPDELREALREAAHRARFHALLALLDEVSAHDGRLAHALRELVERFAYGQVLALVEPTSKG